MTFCLFVGVEWGLLYPEANGQYQSPININSRESLYDPSLLECRLSPNYVVCRDCEVVNDGRVVQILLKSKSGMLHTKQYQSDNGYPLLQQQESSIHKCWSWVSRTLLRQTHPH